MNIVINVKSHWISICVMTLFVRSVEIFNFNVAWRWFWFRLWFWLRLWFRYWLWLRFWLGHRLRFWLLQIFKSVKLFKNFQRGFLICGTLHNSRLVALKVYSNEWIVFNSLLCSILLQLLFIHVQFHESNFISVHKHMKEVFFFVTAEETGNCSEQSFFFIRIVEPIMVLFLGVLLDEFLYIFHTSSVCNSGVCYSQKENDN